VHASFTICSILRNDHHTPDVDHAPALHARVGQRCEHAHIEASGVRTRAVGAASSSTRAASVSEGCGQRCGQRPAAP
jgi:hypothetical protein